MARTSKGPRYYPSLQSWVANLQGERIVLAKGPKRETEQEAKERYAQEVAARRVSRDGDRAAAWQVLNAYALWCKTRTEPPPVAPNTLRAYLQPLNAFIAVHGNVLVRDLRPSHFDQFLREMKKERVVYLGRKVSWGPRTRHRALIVLRSAFHWARTVGSLISVDPMEQVPRRPFEHVPQRLAMTEEEYRLLVDFSLRRRVKDFGELLVLLWATGARPAEVYLAQAREWDPITRSFVIEPEGNEGRFKLARLGKVRRVYVPDLCVPLVEVLMRKCPEGPLFRAESGKPFDNTVSSHRLQSTIAGINRRARRELVRPGLNLYGARHAFCTNWIVKGGNLAHLAALLNTSVGVITRHYSHLLERHDTLRESLNKAV